MPITSRVRWELARRPWIYWTIVVGVAIVAAATVSGAQRHADAERIRWGATAPVVVATRDLAAGDPAVGLEVRHHPLAVVPDGAVGELPALGTVRRSVRAGQMLTDADLAAGDGPLALVPDGHVLVAVTERIEVGAVVGDVVTVVTDGVVLTESALVVGRGRDGPLLGVPADLAAAVAAGASSPGGVALLRHP